MKKLIISLIIIIAFQSNIKAQFEVTYCAVWSPFAEEWWNGPLGSCELPNIVCTPAGCVIVSWRPAYVTSYWVPETFISVFEREQLSHFAGWPTSQIVINNSPLVSNLVMGTFGMTDIEPALGGLASTRTSSGKGDYYLNAHVGPVYFAKEATQDLPAGSSEGGWGGNCIYYSTRQDAFQWRTGLLDLLNPANLIASLPQSAMNCASTSIPSTWGPMRGSSIPLLKPETSIINALALKTGPACDPAVNVAPILFPDLNCYSSSFTMPRTGKTRAASPDYAAYITAIKAYGLAANSASVAGGSKICGQGGIACFPMGTPAPVVAQVINTKLTPLVNRWAYILWSFRSTCADWPYFPWEFPKHLGFCGEQPGLMAAEMARQAGL